MKEKGQTNGALGNLYRLRMAGYDHLGLHGRSASDSEGAAASAAALAAIQN